MPPHLFTVEEATRLLPQLEEILPHLRALRQEIVTKQRILEEMRSHVRGNGGSPTGSDFSRLKKELEALLNTLRTGVRKIEEMGCVLKDLEVGLVDFPTLREGVEVFLCWRVGEEEIGYWHSVNEGFAGRKPLRGDPL